MKYIKEDEYSIIKYLRFRNKSPYGTKKVYMPYRHIA